MARQAPLDLSPFGKVIIREDTMNGRPMTRINYPGRGRVDKTHETVEEANDHLLEEKARSLAGYNRLRAPVTIRVLAEDWYATRQRQNMAPKTLAADRAYLDARIIPDWGDWRVDQIFVEDVQAWIDRIESEPHLNARGGELLTEGMVHKYRRCFDQVLRHGIRKMMIRESPAAADLIVITRHRETPADEQVFTDDELTALWHIIDPRYRALVPLGAYGAGLRIGEWAGLAETDFAPRSRDLSFRRKVIDVRGRVLVEDWLKGDKPGRTIRLGPDMAEVWMTHVARFARNGWVFPAPSGGLLSPGNFRNRIWRPAVEAIGRPGAKFHWLRHSHVTKLREEGIDLEAISKHVGHANVEITSRVYSHQTDAINEQIAEAGDRLLARLDR